MTIEEVAKLAGVSNSTVSRVINEHPRVAPETVKAVRAAMATLNYVPSERRPGPRPTPHGRERKTANIAFLLVGVPRGSTTPAFDELLRGVSSAASDLGAHLSFAYSSETGELPAGIDQRVDGFLLHGAVPAMTDELRSHPCVWLMGNRRRPDWGDQVMPDTYDVGAKAAAHLIGRGHQRLAFLNLDAGHWSFLLTRHSFATHAEKSGATVVALERPRVESPGYWPRHSLGIATQLVEELLALDPRPTGILIADDMQTSVLQPVLQQHGIQLGAGQTEIVSVNNEQPYLVGLTPRPAVLDLRFAAVGRRGVEQLLWRLEHRDVRERIITAIEPTLVTAI